MSGAVSRCEPIASLLCHALTRALKLQLGKSAEAPLTDDDLAALREALVRQDGESLGLLQRLVSAGRQSHESSNGDPTEDTMRSLGISCEEETASEVSFGQQKGTRERSGTGVEDEPPGFSEEPQAAAQRGWQELHSPTGCEAEETALFSGELMSPTFKSEVRKFDAKERRQVESKLFSLDASERLVYQPADVAFLLRTIARSADLGAKSLAAFDENNDGVLQADEIGAFFQSALGVQLLEAEGRALHDLLDNSLETIRLRDFVAFLGHNACPNLHEPQVPGRVVVGRANTVTAVAVSPCGRRVACGGMDYVVSVYDARRFFQPVFEQRYPKQIAALALGKNALAVGCFGGRLRYASDPLSAQEVRPFFGQGDGVERLREEEGGSSSSKKTCGGDRFLPHADRAVMTPAGGEWDLGKDVAAVALNEDDAELAACAGAEVRIYDLRTGSATYVFTGRGNVLSVSLARTVFYRAELADGTLLCVDSGVETQDASNWPVLPDDVDATQTKTVDNKNGGSHRRGGAVHSSSSSSSSKKKISCSAVHPVDEASMERTKPPGLDAAEDDESGTTNLVAQGQLVISRATRAKLADLILDTFDSAAGCVAVCFAAVAASAVGASVLFGALSSSNDAARLFVSWTAASFVLETATRVFCLARAPERAQRTGARICLAVDAAVLLSVALTALRPQAVRWSCGGVFMILRSARLGDFCLKDPSLTNAGLSEDTAPSVGYAVRLRSGPTVRNVSRTDVLSRSEKEYIRLKRRVDAMEDSGQPASVSHCGLESSSRSFDPSGSRHFLRSKFARRRWSSSSEERLQVRRRLDPRVKRSLGEHDRMPVSVRLPTTSLSSEVRKFVAFGGEAQHLFVWTYDLTEAQLEQDPHQPDLDNYLSRSSGSFIYADDDGGDDGGRHCSRCAHVNSPSDGAGQKTVTPLARQELGMRFQHAVACVHLAGDARRVAGCARGLVFVYDFVQRSVVFRHKTADLVYSVALSFSGDELLFGGAAKHVELRDVASGATLFRVPVQDRTRAVALARTGKTVVIGGFDATMQVHNVEQGATTSVVESADVVRSVDLSDDGQLLACGGDDCRVRVFALTCSNDISYEMWQAVHRAKVWVVAISPGSKFVAAGDYANAVVVYDAKTGEHVWQKTEWAGAGAPFTWSVSWSGCGAWLAIGKWDSYAYLIRVGSEWREAARVKRGDRVYGAVLNRRGSLLCVGGRDKRAAVYRIVASQNWTKDPWAFLDLDFETPRQHSFVYCVGLSFDDRLLAVGCVDGSVPLFSIPDRRLVRTVSQDGLVQNLAFSPVAYHLAIASEQNFVDVWDVDPDLEEPRCRLVLRRHTTSHSVALSATGLAFASGTLVSTCGVGKFAPRWTDRISFDTAQACLEYPRTLDILLREHPTIVNAQSPLNGESVLQFAVRKKSVDTVRRLLKADCRVGLLPDSNGNNALTVALENERKTCLADLLDATMGMLKESPLLSTCFTDIHDGIADKYPDLHLNFLKRARLIRDDSLAPLNKNFALIPTHVPFLTAGADEHSPADFWNPCLLTIGGGGGPAGKKNTRERTRQQLRSDKAPSLGWSQSGRGPPETPGSRFWFSSAAPGGPGGKYKQAATTTTKSQVSLATSSASSSSRTTSFSGYLNSTKRAHCKATSYSGGYRPESTATEMHRRHVAHRAKLGGSKKTEVVALRVPFEYVLGNPGTSQESILSVVAKSSAFLEEYDVYSSPLIQCIIEFKWSHFAKRIFLLQMSLSIVHFFVVAGLYFGLTQDALGLSWRRRFAECKIAVLSFGPAFVLSAFFLAIELRQLLYDGAANYYLSGQRHWKLLDLTCFGLQLFIDALLLSRVQFAVAFLAAVNLLLFTARIISFARGFHKWGPLIRMIVKIVYEVRFFVAIVLVGLLGFCASFAVLLRHKLTLWLVVYLFQSGLFAHVAEEEHVEPNEWRPRSVAVVLLFQVFMLIVTLLVLNLLIAIMNSAYEEVKASAVQEMLHEKSQIINSIERLWLPMLVRHYRLPPSYFTPKWLLVLAPAAHFPPDAIHSS